MNTTGFEPTLIVKNNRRGYQRLSSRYLSSLLGALPANALSLNAAAEMVAHGGFYARYHAARLLCERGSREARLIMQDILNTGSGPARASAARHLHHFSWFAAEPLLRQAIADPEERVRESAVYALCDSHERAAYDLLTALIPGETDTIKEAAAWGLRSCTDKAAVPILAAVMTAHDPDVRIRALEVLSANNTAEAARLVRAALHEADAEVVYNAVLSLIELEGEGCILEISQLIEKTENLEPVLRGLFHATNYLHLPLAEHPAVHVLLDSLARAVIDPMPETREAVVWILAWMRHEHATDLLKYAYFHEENGTVKAHILRVTLALMNEAGNDLLEDALVSSDPFLVRTAQVYANQQSSAHYDSQWVAAAPLSRDELAWH